MELTGETTTARVGVTGYRREDRIGVELGVQGDIGEIGD